MANVEIGQLKPGRVLAKVSLLLLLLSFLNGSSKWSKFSALLFLFFLLLLQDHPRKWKEVRGEESVGDLLKSISVRWLPIVAGPILT